jgi:hypothetical protein
MQFNELAIQGFSGYPVVKLQLVKSLNDPLAGCNFTHPAGNCSPARADGQGGFA